MIYYIETTAFDTMQRLSIFVYGSTIKNRDFKFEEYYETTYKETINSCLEYLLIKDVENYKKLFHKYLKEIYDLSKKNAELYLVEDISNRKELFAYWNNKKKLFVKEVVDVYNDEQKS